MARELQDFRLPGVNDTTTADVALQALESAVHERHGCGAAFGWKSSAVWGPSDQGSTCGARRHSCDPWVAAVSSAARGRMLVVVRLGMTELSA